MCVPHVLLQMFGFLYGIPCPQAIWDVQLWYIEFSWKRSHPNSFKNQAVFSVNQTQLVHKKIIYAWVCHNLDLFGEFMACFSQQKYLHCYHVWETYCYLVLFCIPSRTFQIYPLAGFKLIANFPCSSRLTECLLGGVWEKALFVAENCKAKFN